MIATLAERGHAVHAAVEHGESLGGRAMVEALAARFPDRVTFGESPVRSADDAWGDVAAWIRLGLDYLRYQHPLFDDAPRLRERAADRTPDLFVRLSRVPRGTRLVRRGAAGGSQPAGACAPGRRRDPCLSRSAAARSAADHAARRSRLVADRLPARRAGDGDSHGAVRVELGSSVEQGAHPRVAGPRVRVERHPEARGGRTARRATPHASSSPARSASITGSIGGRRGIATPSAPRPAYRRIARCVVYVCSALLQGSPPEAPFVVDWIRRLRASASPQLASAAILVRPHPSRLSEWDGRRPHPARPGRPLGPKPGRRASRGTTTSTRCSMRRWWRG